MNGTPLDFLTAVYTNADLPLSVRLRAAIEAAPYIHPKLSATAYVPMGEGFAKRLERAIERSREGPKLIEHAASAVELRGGRLHPDNE
jgi:hypothetical protein